MIEKRSIDDINRWKYKCGFKLTPIEPYPSKKPQTKDGTWERHNRWTDEQLLNAERLGFFHKESGVFTVDFDDKDYVAHKFLKIFPHTFTDGKFIKFPDKDNVATTHLTYKVNGQGALKFKYPTRAKGKDDGLLVETLTSTQTIFTGRDRFEGYADATPQEVDIKELEKYLKLTCFFTEVIKVYKVGEGSRDEFNLRLTGALARLDEKEYSIDILNSFHDRFLEIVDDYQDVKNRMKTARQRQNLKEGKNVFGIKDLSKFLGDVELEAYNLLKSQEEDAAQIVQDSDPKDYPLIDGNMEDVIEYPPVEYLMEPIINTRSFNQTFGWYESGKTVFGIALSMHMSSGHDFLGWKCNQKIPTAYLESELPGATLQNIRKTVRLDWLDKNKEYNADWTFMLNQDDLINAGFKYGFKSIAVAKEHGKKAAEDYGRRGREFIESWLNKIEQKTGVKPFYFLDNMTRLATIDENKQTDWNPFLNWGTDLKHKGFSGMFVHHANKGKENKGSSGSSAIGRLLDTSIKLEGLDREYRFDIPGRKNLQSSIEFDKSRGFGGSEWSKKRIITMDENGTWKHYPYLKQVSFEILKLHKQGLTQQQIRNMHKEIGNPPLSSSSVDRYYKQLVELNLIETKNVPGQTEPITNRKKREAHCWSCKQPISHDSDERCQKCGYGIICLNETDEGETCGKCHCENPKRKKNENS